MVFERFSKPNWRRILIFIMIYIILIFFVMTLGIVERNCEFTIKKGVPFHYFSARGGACKKDGVIQLIEFRTQFSTIVLISDVLIWGIVSYFLSSLIVWVYEKTKKKS